MKTFSRSKLRLLSKKRKKKEESLKSKEKRMHWIISRKPRRKKDLDKSKLSSNSLSIVRLLSLWRLETKRKKFWISKLLKLKIKQLNYLKKRKEEELRWQQQLKEAEKIKSKELIRKSQINKPKKKNLLNFGKWEMKSLLLLNSKRRKKRDREELSWPIIWRNRLKIRISRLKKTSSMSNTQPSETNHFRTNRRRISTLMLKSASKSGPAKAKT